jgi:sulfate permease
LYSELLLPLLAAMFLAVNMGASGTAPSFAAAYGANIVKRLAIPGIYGLCVLLGAIVAGKRVGITMGKELIPPEMLTPDILTIILFSVGLSMLVANYLAVPQSTSQATVFAISGPAIFYSQLNTHKLLYEIIPAWFILPAIGFIITLLIGKLLYKRIKESPLVDYDKISNHLVLKILVLVSSCYVAFSIGANNVANASGPIASMVLNELGIDAESEDNFIMIITVTSLIIAPCFAIGSSLFGHRLLQSTGKSIIEFGPVGATLVATVTASLLLLASITKGIPTSLVQLNTFAIIAVGMSKVGWKKVIVDRTVQKFWIVWIIAPLFSLALSYTLTALAHRYGIILF